MERSSLMKQPWADVNVFNKELHILYRRMLKGNRVTPKLFSMAFHKIFFVLDNGYRFNGALAMAGCALYSFDVSACLPAMFIYVDAITPEPGVGDYFRLRLSLLYMRWQSELPNQQMFFGYPFQCNSFRPTHCALTADGTFERCTVVYSFFLFCLGSHFGMHALGWVSVELFLYSTWGRIRSSVEPSRADVIISFSTEHLFVFVGSFVAIVQGCVGFIIQMIYRR